MSGGYCMTCKGFDGWHFDDCVEIVPPPPTLEEIQASWAKASGQPVQPDPPTWRELWDEVVALRGENNALRQKLKAISGATE